MPDDLQSDPGYWRERANLLREDAANTREEETRDTMLLLAEVYDHVADRQRHHVREQQRASGEA
jgi:hypothetical protein